MNLIHNIYALNEKSVTIDFGNEISLDLADLIERFNQALKANPFPGFSTTVPAYTSLTVYYDPMVMYTSSLKGKSNFDKVSAYLKTLIVADATTGLVRRRITIPICYGAEFGPDLDEVSAYSKISVDEIIKIHSSSIYVVHMIGFVPGFAYLGGMDTRLSTPRRKTPRAKVPSGSIGIAGQQTGIYSLNTPGGWQIIGRTPLTLFDPNRKEASLLKAGDEVSFEPVSVEKFNSM